MSCSACLVLSPPEYESPPQTAPYLIATAASPPIKQIITIDDKTKSVEFSGSVLSEDNGVPVELALYIDFGQCNAANEPYKRKVYPLPKIAAGTIADGPRPFFGKKWFMESVPVANDGCHTVTMMVSHKFNDIVCPADLNDSSLLTWQVVQCGEDPSACPTTCAEPEYPSSRCAPCDSEDAQGSAQR
jgi:hypothetical protein